MPLSAAVKQPAAAVAFVVSVALAAAGHVAAAAPITPAPLRSGPSRLGQSAPAPPAPVERTIAGEVVSRTSRWSQDDRSILTRSVIRAADGSKQVVWQLGGTVNGIGMRVTHMPPLLRVGAQVRAALRRTTTGDGDGAWQLTSATPRIAAPRKPGNELAPAPSGESTTSAAFVNEVTSHGTPLYWASDCVFITYDARGTTEIPGDTEFGVMDQVLKTWRQATASCSYLTLERTAPQFGEAGDDGVNLVIFREKEWCRPASGGDPKICYDPTIAALTTLAYVDDPSNARDGQILDADVEINAHDFAVSVNGQTSSSVQCHAELANTFTHEMGHVMGLDHTCYDGSGPHLDDNTGAPVPSCSEANLPAKITDATMYNYQACGETKKETPTQDDIDGVCSLYPLGESPGACTHPAPVHTSSGCAIAAASEPAAPGPCCWLIWSVAVAVCVRRRRRT